MAAASLPFRLPINTPLTLSIRAMATPSYSFKIMLPVKPSATTTSAWL